ncbi:MAG: hypothetical protein ACRDUY_02240, partial [Nitriliruptorales bacterium]
MNSLHTQLAVSMLSGLVVGGIGAWLLRPLPRLAQRVRPYTAASLPELGDTARVLGLEGGPAGLRALLQLFVPPVRAAADRLGRVVDHRSERQLALQLRQARLFEDVPLGERVTTYRLRQLGSAAAA